MDSGDQIDRLDRLLADSIPQHLWVASPDGLLQYANQRCVEYFGLSAAELGGTGWQEGVHREDLATCLEAWNRALTTGEEYEVEFRLRHARDGAYRWHLSRAVPMRETGRIVRWLGTNTDIDDQKRAGARATTQYALTRAVAESSTVQEASARALQAVCETLGWEAAGLWRIDTSGIELRCAAFWHAPGLELSEFERRTRTLSLRYGEELPGEVWESHGPMWVENVVDSGTRAGVAASHGLRSAFAFPVVTGNEPRGVLEFFSRETRAPDPELIELMTAVGAQMGQYLESAYAREAVRESEARKSAILLERHGTQQRRLDSALAALAGEKARVERFADFAARLARERTTPERLADVILRGLEAASGADAGAIYVVGDEDRKRLALAATEGLSSRALPAVLELEAGALSGGQLEALRAAVPGCTRDVRLSHGDELLGVALLRSEDARMFETVDMEQAVNQACVALCNALSLQTARRLANVNSALLDSTDEGIVMVDRDGEVQFVNARIRKLEAEGTFPSSGTISERHAALARQLVEPDVYLADMAKVAADPELEASGRYDFRSSRTVECYTAPVRDRDGTVIGRIIVFRDVTAEQQAERTKSEFVATVSHELRTPLTGILGFAEILLDNPPPPQTGRAFLETIHEESRRLKRLVDDLLDLHRIDEGVRVLRRQPVDLRRLLVEALELAVARTKQHVVGWNLSDDPLEVSADPDRIRQVVRNLLSNAIKYSPDGGSVLVTAGRSDGLVRVSVKDTGTGIPAVYHDQIFGQFFRVDSSDTRRIRGAGLGLTLSREIVTAHGGTIGFESEEGVGSTFWFELPTKEHDISESRQAPSPSR